MRQEIKIEMRIADRAPPVLLFPHDLDNTTSRLM